LDLRQLRYFVALATQRSFGRAAAVLRVGRAGVEHDLELRHWQSLHELRTKVGRVARVHHQTVQRCVERALAYGPLAALDDRPRPGKEPTITAEAKAWVADIACRKAKELGYPHEVWTTRLLARHVREHGPAEGHRQLLPHKLTLA
jgi:hypothetical protein